MPLFESYSSGAAGQCTGGPDRSATHALIIVLSGSLRSQSVALLCTMISVRGARGGSAVLICERVGGVHAHVLAALQLCSSRVRVHLRVSPVLGTVQQAVHAA